MTVRFKPLLAVYPCECAYAGMHAMQCGGVMMLFEF